MFGLKNIKKLKISNSANNELRSDAVWAEKNNIVVCGVLLGEMSYVNVGLKRVYQVKCSQIMNFEALRSSNMIRKIKRVREGFFSGNHYDIIIPKQDITGQRQEVIGIYVFYPRALKKLEEEIKRAYRKKQGTFSLLLLAYFENAGNILKKEKAVRGIGGFMKSNEIRELQTLKSQISSMQMDILCFEKNMHPVGVEIVVQ